MQPASDLVLASSIVAILLLAGILANVIQIATWVR
jgi:hypothetical protein